MKAIVYTSQTGHTQRYAQMLAERTGVPAYSLKEAGKSLRRGEEIFYMGDAFGRAVDRHPLAFGNALPDELQNALQMLHGQNQGVAVGQEHPLNVSIVGAGPFRLSHDSQKGFQPK